MTFSAYQGALESNFNGSIKTTVISIFLMSPNQNTVILDSNTYIYSYIGIGHTLTGLCHCRAQP
jgi:hypothetical protein